MDLTNFKIEVDADGVALITFDSPNKSMNTITPLGMAEIGLIAERLKTDATITGAIFQSGKANAFCAGADLGEMEVAFQPTLTADMTADQIAKASFEKAFALNKVLRALETCGKPVAIALEGLALGGGLELALACHYRVVADNPKIKLGLPEIKVGLFPGGGGSQRLPRLMGAQSALMLMLQGGDMNPSAAKMNGMVHEVVPAGDCVAACRKWLASKPRAQAPWDDKSFKVPQGGPYHPNGFMVFVGGNAMLAKQSYGNYPAAENCMKAVYEGLQVPFDAALRIESRYFAKTLASPQAKAMIRSLFHSLQALGKGGNRPAGFEAYGVKKVTVLGAGMMGAGIAYVQAMAGIETVLIDRDLEAAEKGKSYSKGLLDKAVSRGKSTAEKAAATLDLIKASTDYADVDGSDLVIEAVFESRDIKADVTKKAEAHLRETAVFGSNTSTIPITLLSEASARPKNFIGVHFFSPVDKMGLVEIIIGKDTSNETLAKAIDYVLKIKKTPIVVNDSRGFYTSRCFSTYVNEGVTMLAEGIAPAIIENVGRMTGMPVPPLAMSDEVALDLAHKISEAARHDLGDKFVETPASRLIAKMVTELGRYGRKNAMGFYDYPAEKDGKKKLWPGLRDLVTPTATECPPVLREELRKRLLFIQSIETARCFEEGVITDPRDADIGSILGWGFAPWSGGTISFIDGMGCKAFVAEADRLADAHGERFRPNALLRDMAAKGETFYTRFASGARVAA